MEDQVTLAAYAEEIRALIHGDQAREALAVCQHILRYYPKHIATYVQMGEAYLETGDIDAAQELFRRVLSADPENVIAYAGLGIAYEQQTLTDEAIWHLERAYEHAPANDDIRQELLRLYEEREGKPRARLKLTPGGLAHLYLTEGLYAQATQEFRVISTASPKRFDARVGLAEALWRAGRVRESVDVAQSILNNLPYCLKANLILGTAWQESGLAEGESFLQRAQALDPMNRVARELLGAKSPLPAVDALVPRYDGRTPPEPLAATLREPGLSHGEGASADWFTEPSPIETSPASETAAFEPELPAGLEVSPFSSGSAETGGPYPIPNPYADIESAPAAEQPEPSDVLAAEAFFAGAENEPGASKAKSSDALAAEALFAEADKEPSLPEAEPSHVLAAEAFFAEAEKEPGASQVKSSDALAAEAFFAEAESETPVDEQTRQAPAPESPGASNVPRTKAKEPANSILAEYARMAGVPVDEVASSAGAGEPAEPILPPWLDPDIETEPPASSELAPMPRPTTGMFTALPPWLIELKELSNDQPSPVAQGGSSSAPSSPAAISSAPVVSTEPAVAPLPADSAPHEALVPAPQGQPPIDEVMETGAPAIEPAAATEEREPTRVPQPVAEIPDTPESPVSIELPELPGIPEAAAVTEIPESTELPDWLAKLQSGINYEDAPKPRETTTRQTADEFAQESGSVSLAAEQVQPDMSRVPESDSRTFETTQSPATGKPEPVAETRFEWPGAVEAEVPAEAPFTLPSEAETETPAETRFEWPGAVEAEAPAETPFQLPSEAETETPAETRFEWPGAVEAEVPAETPFKLPSEAEAVTPAETRFQWPGAVEAEAPAETPFQLPSEAETETPAETRFEWPGAVEAEAPAETPLDLPSEAEAETPAETRFQWPGAVEAVPAETPFQLPSVAETPAETRYEWPGAVEAEAPAETPFQLPSEAETPAETRFERPGAVEAEAPAETPLAASEVAGPAPHFELEPIGDDSNLGNIPVADSVPAAREQAEKLQGAHAIPVSEPSQAPAAQPKTEPTTSPEPLRGLPAGEPAGKPRRRRTSKASELLERARELRDSGRLAEALSQYDDIVQHAPRLTAQVISDLEELVGHPDVPLETHRILGDVYTRADRLSEALERYRFVLDRVNG